jgi:hypothetical protein
VIDLFGRTESVTINSGCRLVPGVGSVPAHSTTLAAMSPGQASLRSSRLQDSLELLGVRSPSSPVVAPPPPPLPPTQLLPSQPLAQQTLQPSAPSLPPALAFHERHGRNIQLSNSRTTARRTASYNQGIVVGDQPLPCGVLFQVS